MNPYGKHSRAVQFCTETRTMTHTISFKWTICDFQLYLETENDQHAKINSPKFSSPTEDKYQFYLQLCPKGDRDEYKDYMSIFLCRLADGNMSPIRVQLKLYMTKNGERNSHYFSSRFMLSHSQPGRGWGKFMSRDQLLDNANGFLPDGTLTIYCEVNIYTQLIHNVNQNETQLIEEQASKQLASDMATLLNDSFADVILSVGAQEFSAHKCVLSARSPVFAAMFKYNLLENQQNRVVIADVDENVFKELLSFIYTGTVSCKNKLNGDLLSLSDKLSSTLSIESVAEVLMLSEMHNVSSLKRQCVQHISRYGAKVFATQAWKELATTRSDIALNALQDYIINSK